MIKKLLSFPLFLFVTGQVPAATLYVDQNAAPGGDGSGWLSAFQSLQDALDEAGVGDEVWIAAGTYFPDEGGSVVAGDRQATFTLKAGMTLYGGFAGGEDSLDDRNWEANPTVLSGEIGLEKDSWSLHVVTLAGSATLDGLTITNGNANGDPSGHSYGGGVLNEEGDRLEIANCIFLNNSASGGGGAVFSSPFSRGSSSITITNSDFRGNSASKGGAIYVSAYVSYGLFVSNSVFDQNRASEGGAIYTGSTTSASSEVLNTVFTENSALIDGGAIYSSSDLTATNSVFAANSASRGGAIYLPSFSFRTLTAINSTFFNNRAQTANGGGAIFSNRPTYVFNNIFWHDEAEIPEPLIHISSGGELHNQDLDLSSERAKNLIRRGSNGISVESGGVLDLGEMNLTLIETDPLFVDPLFPVGPDGLWGTADDGLRLQPTSPAIDQGSEVFLPKDRLDLNGNGDLTEMLPVDIAGFERVQQIAVDLGAYEDFGYAGWLVSYGLSGPDAEDLASPAHDGMPNLLKYALGLSPLEPINHTTDGTNRGRPILQTSADSMTFIFVRDNSRQDVTLICERSTDLIDWEPITAGIKETPIGDSLVRTEVSVTSELKAVFLRLTAER